MDPNVFKTVMAVGRRMGATRKQLLAAAETGLVESGFTNPSAMTDHDSQGWRQERRSLYPNPTNVEASAARFFQEAKQHDRPGLSAGDLAAAVQRPAAQYRGRYQQTEARAAALLGMKGGDVSARVARTASVGGGGGGSTTTNLPGATFKTTVPTVDQSAFEGARRNAIIGQLIARRNPNSILLRSGLLSTVEPSLSEFMGQQTTTSRVPGKTVTVPGTSSSSGSSGPSVSGGPVHSPVGRSAKVIGVPHQGTHTLGNWQSDNAVDIAVPIGSPMLALQDGVVVKVRHHPQGAGRFAGDQITIRGANGNEYFYAHGVAHVRPGQRIRKGQKLGTTGSANGVAHLHFGQMRGDPRAHT